MTSSNWNHLGGGSISAYGNAGANSLYGNAGANSLHGYAGADALYGNAGADKLYGNIGADVLYGNGGADKLYGNIGADVLYGNGGADKLYGNAGTDVLYGNAGADRLYGLLDDDVIFGGNSNDLIFGGKGNDRIFGGRGDDTIRGGKGADILVGGSGSDTFAIAPGTGGASLSQSDLIIDFTVGKDSIQLTEGLTVENLNISTNAGNTVIKDKTTGEIFAVLQGVAVENPSLLNLPNPAIAKNDPVEAIAPPMPLPSRETETKPPVIKEPNEPMPLPDKGTGTKPPVTEEPVEAIAPSMPLPDEGTGTKPPVTEEPVEPIAPPMPPRLETGTIRPVTADPGNTWKEALGIAGSSNTLTYKEQVSQSDPADFYTFSVGASSTLTLSLTGLNHNADLFFLDSANNVIQGSEGSGITDEFITQPLETGSYVIQVKGLDPETTDYNLNVNLSSNLPGITTEGSDGVSQLFTGAASKIIRLDPGDPGDPVVLTEAFRTDPRFAGIDGRGFSSVILDTGIDLDHPYFGPDTDGNGISDRIVYQQDFADKDNDASARPGDDHGSNVSSIVAGSSFNGRPEPQFITYEGVAPGANIIHLKVFPDGRDTVFDHDIETALDWVLGTDAGDPISRIEKYNIASVNMSLGRWNYNQPISIGGIEDELARLKAENVIVVSATGNEFAKGGSVPGVAWPAAEPDSLAVSAIWDRNVGRQPFESGAIDYSTGTQRITSFSQRDPNLTDILAPGGAILGANATGGTIEMSGTSQAAPHIAGIAVLAQQLAVQKLGRRLTVDEFRDLLRSTGTQLRDGDDEDDNVTNTGFSYPQVDVLALGKAILRIPPLNASLVRYNFTYFYDGGTGSSSEHYDGYVFAPPGSLGVGASYDPVAAPNERGTNGIYKILSEEAASDTAVGGQVFVQKYYREVTPNSVNTAIPVSASSGLPAGSNGLGSEITFAPTKDATGKPTLELFGADFWAADLNNRVATDIGF